MIDFSPQSLLIKAAIFAVAAIVVWIAGTKLSRYVDIDADRTELGHAFAGALILGGADPVVRRLGSVAVGHLPLRRRPALAAPRRSARLERETFFFPSQGLDCHDQRPRTVDQRRRAV